MNATYLKFPRSDGSSEWWPTNKLDSRPTDMGEINYMKHMDLDASANIRWRIQIGREVAKLLGQPDFENCVLEDFPQGYRLYEHNKGFVEGTVRTDLYLFGAQGIRFRSTAEFIRHAFWLMTDETLNRKNCQCKYCGVKKKSQTEISKDLGLLSGHSPSKVREISVDEHRAKLRQILDAKEKTYTTDHSNVVARMSDLRSNRCFRSGEVVWCALDPPIQGEQDCDRIEFWPVLVKDLRLRTEVKHKNECNALWDVSQTLQYKIKFLGIGCSEVVPEHSLLPYQAYGPSPVLIDRLRVEGDPNLLIDGHKTFQGKLRPLGVDITSCQPSFKEAATPFALSIQVSAHLLRFWTPEYEFFFLGEVPSWENKSQDDHAVQQTQVKELRYEGLWWGAERIWVDEVVRLIPSRGQVLQKSTYISRPSPQSEARGVLMRLNAIISRQGVGEKERTCKIAGTLYELAHEDFQEDDQKPISLQAAENTNIPVSESAGTHTSVVMPFVNVQKLFKGLPARPAPLMPPNLLFDLPKPPPGYKLRAITPPGYEIVLDVAMIAGRYYSDILENKLTKGVLSANKDGSQVSQLEALCGLDAGAMNSMECHRWCENRSTMVQQADSAALSELIAFWKPEFIPEPIPDIMQEEI